jgi:hypothetical protein
VDTIRVNGGEKTDSIKIIKRVHGQGEHVDVSAAYGTWKGLVGFLKYRTMILIDKK